MILQKTRFYPFELLSKKKEREKKKKERRGIEKRMTERVCIAGTLLLPEETIPGKRRRCGSRREEWVSLFDRNLAGEGGRRRRRYEDK